MKKFINAIGPIAFTLWFAGCLGLIVFGFFSIGSHHADTRSLVSVTEASAPATIDLDDLTVGGTRVSYLPPSDEPVTVGSTPAFTHKRGNLVVKLADGNTYAVLENPAWAGKKDGDPCEVHVSMDRNGTVTNVSNAFCGSEYAGKYTLHASVVVTSTVPCPAGTYMAAIRENGNPAKCLPFVLSDMTTETEGHGVFLGPPSSSNMVARSQTKKGKSSDVVIIGTPPGGKPYFSEAGVGTGASAWAGSDNEAFLIGRFTGVKCALAVAQSMVDKTEAQDDPARYIPICNLSQRPADAIRWYRANGKDENR